MVLDSSSLKENSSSAKFKEHEVQRGDWLYDIGRRHNVDLRSLLKANPNLSNPDSLHVGSRIKIPQVPSSSSVCIPPASARNPKLESTSNNKSWSLADSLTLSKVFILLGNLLCRDRAHKVVDGDSLQCIADRYGTSVSALKKLNNLHSDTIYSGSLLKIDRALTQCRRSNLGRKATYRERNGMLEGFVGPANPSSIVSRNIVPIALKTVKVQYGDTLANIASANGLSIRELQKLNHIRDDVIYEGDVLAVAGAPSYDSIHEDIRAGRRRTNRPLFSRHISPSQTSSWPVGGPSLTLKTRVATGGIKLEGRWKRKSKGFQITRDRWLQFNSPLTDGFISSSFGWRWGAYHEGVDLAADQGTPILASDRGTVTFSGWSGGYGYMVAIQHEGGFLTRYAHCCAIHARVGQQVVRGQQVASVGATGHATGPHLHFEVRRNGQALDPLKWVNL